MELVAACTLHIPSPHLFAHLNLNRWWRPLPLASGCPFQALLQTWASSGVLTEARPGLTTKSAGQEARGPSCLAQTGRGSESLNCLGQILGPRVLSPLRHGSVPKPRGVPTPQPLPNLTGPPRSRPWGPDPSPCSFHFLPTSGKSAGTGQHAASLVWQTQPTGRAWGQSGQESPTLPVLRAC